MSAWASRRLHGGQASSWSLRSPFFAIAGAAGSVLLQLASDNGGEDPGLQISLLVWIILRYVLSGLVAWYRSPESRFGPLMIAAGFVTLLSSLSSANSNPVYDVRRRGFDLVPFAVFMHVFLAFPTGLLRSRGERLLVGTSYAIAVDPQVVDLLLGGFDRKRDRGDRRSRARQDLHNVSSSSSPASSWAVGDAVQPSQRRRPAAPNSGQGARQPRSRWRLSSAAVLLSTSAFTIAPETFLTLQRVTLFVAGLSPFVFLFAILDARLARSAVGDLLVELRSVPPPTDLREPLARALHDPTLSLAYWLPQYEPWADQDGQAHSPARPEEPRSVTAHRQRGRASRGARA